MGRLGYWDGDGLLERAEQLASLDEVLAVAAGGGRTVLVVGEAGIGKTALLREFGDSVAGSARVLWAACEHLFTPRPLGPFLDLAEAAGGFPPGPWTITCRRSCASSASVPARKPPRKRAG